MSSKQGFNRRDFLKIITAGTGLAASGCAKDVPEKLIPYVVQPDEVVPGNATWYTGTCDECSAGCGVLVRTKEGRVLKVEGNPLHPVNRGGLCALGQSSVQGVYDPDRIREPQKRAASEPFKPATWKEAVDALAEELSKAEDASLKTLYITKPLQASEKKLFSQFISKFKSAEHYEYDYLSHDAISVAAKSLYGKEVRINYAFNQADVILGVGADYLETWMSPVKFSKDFSQRRTPSEAGLSKVYHIEPRLSLTAANADYWYKNAPQTELHVLKSVLYLVSKKKNITAGLKSAVDLVLADFSLSEASKSSGVEEAKISQIASDLMSAKKSLVVSGGASVSSLSEPCALVSLLLNEVLGNVGSSVLVSAVQDSGTAKSLNPQNISSVVSLLDAGKIANVVFVDVNPIYSLPTSSGFEKALSKAKFIACVTKSLDETALVSNLILPLSSNFETWSDSEPEPGVFALNQPAMQPLYKTQGFGDIILSLDTSTKNKFAGQFKDFTEFRLYIESEWRKRIGENRFKSSWNEIVSRGGDWSSDAQKTTTLSVSPNTSMISSLVGKSKKSASHSGICFLAFPTVHYHDGRGANRSWMQEIPDPMTTSVWGSWIEMHPETAESFGFSHGDVVQVKTKHGAVEAPAYVTKHIHPSLVAAPLGLGHTGYGRYASGIGSNASKVLDFSSDGAQLSLLAHDVTLMPSVAQDKLVTLQFSDTEYKRGFVRGITEKEYTKSLHAHDDHGHHGGGHHDPHALGPREKPKQMYEQMDHPTYKWGMTIDLSSCTGCSACVAACYAENNIAVVGKQVCDQGREMSWIKIARYLDGPDEHPVTGFAPSLCQHCANAPCEPVCPVYGTYHSEDGLNTMVYNRCVGTRYCSNNCSYKVRRFNWFNYEWPEPLNWQLNPDVTVRSVGIMEKCTFCIQRIREGQNNAKNEGRLVKDGEVMPACASSCPTNAIQFGNLLDEKSRVAKDAQSKRGYKILDFELNTQPAVTYLAKVTHQQLVAPRDHGAEAHGKKDDAHAHDHKNADAHGSHSVGGH